MESLKIKSFRKDIDKLALRLLAINGYSVNNSYNPHNVRAFILSHEHGDFAVSIGASLHEALDNAVDNDCLDCMKVECSHDEAEQMEYFALGNAGEYFDLSYFDCREVRF